MSDRQTFWRGEPCEAQCVLVTVDPVPGAWDDKLKGAVRAVEVKAGDKTFYLDDEPRYVSPLRGTPSCPGWLGWAWVLVTEKLGHGDCRVLSGVKNISSRPVPSWLD